MAGEFEEGKEGVEVVILAIIMLYIVCPSNSRPSCTKCIAARNSHHRLFLLIHSFFTFSSFIAKMEQKCT